MTSSSEKQVIPAAIENRGYLRSEIEMTKRLVDEAQCLIDVSRQITNGVVEPEASAGEEPHG